MEEDTGILGVIDSLEVVRHCSECGHAWVYDEPAHFADCRFFALEDQQDEDDEGVDTFGWRTFRPALL